MRQFAHAAIVGSVAVMLAVAVPSLNAGQQASPPAGGTAVATPLWAYPVNPPAPPGTTPTPPPRDDGSPKRVAGSNIALTLTQVRDVTNVPDWHPDDHPPMPDIVAHGRKPDVRFGCGYCHYPNGRGRPENAGVAGLPAAHIIQQMADYKAGLRKSSEPRMGPPSLMLQLAKGANDEDVRIAAEYFSSLKFPKWITVVEAKTVPKTRIAGGMFTPIEGGGEEPIGKRVLEVPQDLERTELRDSASPFIAYVPPGSIKQGENLVKTGGGGKTVQCGICHGPDLKGLGPVPPLAGRSPSYTARQLFDFQHGARNGLWADLMKPVVAKLSEDDLIAIVAYTASLTP
jgi:cytochrome c553